VTRVDEKYGSVIRDSLLFDTVNARVLAYGSIAELLYK
jgi:hypothetical protein